MKEKIIKDNVVCTGEIESIRVEKGTWSMVIFRAADNDPLFGGKTVVMVGIPSPMMNVEYKVTGAVVEHETYGLQFKVKKAVPKQNPATLFASFLETFAKGIGGKRAIKAMTDAYGDKLVDVVRDNPEELLNVKYITQKNVDKLKKFYEENFAKMHSYCEIMDILQEEATPNRIGKIYEQFGDKSVAILKSNPYRLIEIDGFGFSTVDKLSIAAGVDNRSIFRFKAAVMYVLEKSAQEDNHVFLTYDEIEQNVMDIIITFKDAKYEKILKGYIHHIKKNDDVEAYEAKYADCIKYLKMFKAEYEKCLDIMSDAVIELMQEGKLIDDNNRLYSRSLFESEDFCAKKIASLSKQQVLPCIDKKSAQKAIDDFERETGMTLNDEQKNAVYKSSSSRVAVITGGAGRGKTTIIKLLISGWKGNVVLCAPTGRAAQRMTESTGIPASTIHRAIYDYSGGKPERRTLPKKSLIIVDEASMINIRLACDLLWSVDDSHIVFVGDADQLPPIGPGNFFATILKSPYVCVSRLTIPYRNMGSINENADLVNRGKTFKNYVFDARSVCIAFEKGEESENILKVWKKARQTYALEDIRIISPLRTRGATCVNELNRLIRECENPKNAKNEIPNSRFRIGDRVMQTANNYKISQWYNNSIKEGSVFNGESGTITGFDETEGYTVVTMDSGEILLYEGADLNDLDLAYANTVHKAQGSEYKCAIFVCMTDHYMMLRRNMLYTGISRAKEMSYLLGMPKAYNIAVMNTQYKEIHCALNMRIENYIAKPKKKI